MIHNVIKEILLFLFGEPHPALYAAITFIVVNFILDFFRKHEPPKTKQEITENVIKRILAYMAFIIAAVRLDALALGSLFGWDGSTQLPVCLYTLSRELRQIFYYIESQGIEIPFILEKRTSQMKHGGTEDNTFRGFHVEDLRGEVDADELDEKLASLKGQMAYVELLRQTNNIKGGEES